MLHWRVPWSQVICVFIHCICLFVSLSTYFLHIFWFRNSEKICGKVNTSRGGLIDNQALIDGLRSGRECRAPAVLLSLRLQSSSHTKSRVPINTKTYEDYKGRNVKKAKGSTRVQIQGVQFKFTFSLVHKLVHNNSICFSHVCETHAHGRLPGKIGGAGLDVVQGENEYFHTDWSNRPEAWQLESLRELEQSLRVGLLPCLYWETPWLTCHSKRWDHAAPCFH